MAKSHSEEEGLSLYTFCLFVLFSNTVYTAHSPNINDFSVWMGFVTIGSNFMFGRLDQSQCTAFLTWYGSHYEMTCRFSGHLFQRHFAKILSAADPVGKRFPTPHSSGEGISHPVCFGICTLDLEPYLFKKYFSTPVCHFNSLVAIASPHFQDSFCTS